jgi:hypothetical protein
MMLQGNGRIKLVTSALCILFSSSVFAYQSIEISPEQTRSLPMSEAYGVSGAQAYNDHYFVIRENDPIIYKMNIDFTGNKKAKLEIFRDLTTLFGKYEFSKNLKDKNYDLEGVTSCKNSQGLCILCCE